LIRQKGYKWKRIGFVAVFVTLACVLYYLPSGYLVISPGPVIELSQVVEIEGYPSTGASFYMVSIFAREAGILQTLGAAVDPNLDLWSKRQLLGGRSVEEYLEVNRDLMERSQVTATWVALSVQGMSAPKEGPFPVRVSIMPGQVAGPSAGLVFALEIITRMDQDIVMGRKIAGTGILDPDGRVLPVGGVAQKTIACREEGIEVFLVPSQNLDEALRFAGDMEVYGVDTVEEAIRVLSSGSNS
jgi:PDZ domain-containing secreted protein